MPTVTLDTSLVDALGTKTAALFQRAFEMVTVSDLLSHYPRRYARRGELTPIASLPLGEQVTIVAEVRSVSSRPMQQRRGTIVEVVISDGEGALTLTFFNQKWRADQLTVGRQGIFSGKVGQFKGHQQLAHPDYALFDDEEVARLTAHVRQNTPIPIYPATRTVASWQVQKAVADVLENLQPVADPLPDDFRGAHGLLDADTALRRIHAPAEFDEIDAARTTLRMHEAFVLQTALLQQRQFVRAMSATSRRAGDLLERFDARLPFERTPDQHAVGDVIAHDLEGDWPMNRLVQGEVGSGKTLVALRAMLQVAQSGGQSALIAPTEVLAAQHVRSIARMLGPDLAPELMPTLLTGQLPAAERRKAALRAASGQARIVVGTHALLSASTTFADLGLVVVDEQHRFGVEQRDSLRAKGAAGAVPHLLVLTATPIPRTVAMTVFGDLDVTTIAELPAGRAPIESHVVPLAERPGWIARVWDRLAEELAAGRQGFVVVPAIAESVAEDEDRPPDGDEAPRAATSTVEGVLALLQSHPAFSGLAVRALHGRMPPEEKDATMRAFAAGEIDALVATTVIEVGVDVPNASVMIVLDADRFGVSQLHQLRGRVGRGGLPGLALFVTAAETGSLARERVEAVAATLDGFALAERDLALRHEGDVLGAAQSGRRSALRLLSAATDGELIAAAREDAIAIVAADPDLADHPALAAAIARRVDDEAGEFLTRA